jgi:hypothetical protein
MHGDGTGNILFTSDGADVINIGPTNAAGTGADLVMISSVLGIMDGSDTFRAFRIDVENVDHTGGANSNTLIGLDIDGIVGDADALEYALRFGTGWDAHIWDDGTGLDIGSDGARIDFVSPSFATIFKFDMVMNSGFDQQMMDVNMTIGIMTGSNTVNGILLDFVNADHTSSGNALYGINFDTIVEDDEAYEAPIRFPSGWDAHFIMQSLTSAPAENPPADAVAYITDDNADYSGGGGNDCAFIAIDDAGGITVIALIRTDAGC